MDFEKEKAERNYKGDSALIDKWLSYIAISYKDKKGEKMLGIFVYLLFGALSFSCTYICLKAMYAEIAALIACVFIVLNVLLAQALLIN